MKITLKTFVDDKLACDLRVVGGPAGGRDAAHGGRVPRGPTYAVWRSGSLVSDFVCVMASSITMISLSSI